MLQRALKNIFLPVFQGVRATVLSRPALGNKAKIYSFCILFYHLCIKILHNPVNNMEKEIFTSIWGIHRPNAGQNAQQTQTRHIDGLFLNKIRINKIIIYIWYIAVCKKQSIKIMAKYRSPHYCIIFQDRLDKVTIVML